MIIPSLPELDSDSYTNFDKGGDGHLKFSGQQNVVFETIIK